MKLGKFLSQGRVGRTLVHPLHFLTHPGGLRERWWWAKHFRMAQNSTNCLACRSIWTWVVSSMPDFKADMEQGQRDIAEGRLYRLDRETGKFVPNPDWPKDGPQPT